MPDEQGPQTRCKKCGKCCRAASPTLYDEDLDSILQGTLDRSRLYALRAGEMVHSSRLDRDMALEQDLVKVRERREGGCVLIDGDLCSIHPDHPLQCRQFECWSGRHAGDLEGRARLDRRDLFRDDERALQLIEEYDVKVPAARLATLLAERSNEAIDLVDLDYRLRGGMQERFGYDQTVLELMLGRPAIVVTRAHGLDVSIDEEGKPFLLGSGS
jgi:Fe-S-cluster containining protein